MLRSVLGMQGVLGAPGARGAHSVCPCAHSWGWGSWWLPNPSNSSFCTIERQVGQAGPGRLAQAGWPRQAASGRPAQAGWPRQVGSGRLAQAGCLMGPAGPGRLVQTSWPPWIQDLSFPARSFPDGFPSILLPGRVRATLGAFADCTARFFPGTCAQPLDLKFELPSTPPLWWTSQHAPSRARARNPWASCGLPSTLLPGRVRATPGIKI